MKSLFFLDFETEVKKVVAKEDLYDWSLDKERDNKIPKQNIIKHRLAFSLSHFLKLFKP